MNVAAMICQPIKPSLVQPLVQYRHDDWQVMIPSLVQPFLVQPLLVQPLLEQHCKDDWPADGAVVGPAGVADVPARAHIGPVGLHLLRQVLEPAVLRSQCI